MYQSLVSLAGLLWVRKGVRSMKLRPRQDKHPRRRVAGYDLGVAKDIFRRLRRPSVVKRHVERGKPEPWSGVAIQAPTEPGAGLGLCDPSALLKPAERAELDRDIVRMMDARRDAQASSDAIKLA